MLERFPGLYLGTSSWTFSGWQGLVYDSHYDTSVLARQGLRAYAQTRLFRTVSLDRTYYRPMTEEELLELGHTLPPDFRLVVKAPRDLLRIQDGVIDRNAFYRQFLTPTVRGLKESLGMILLQFPPGTRAEYGAEFYPALSRFLKDLPTDIHFSLEIRDDSLLRPELATYLRQTSTSLCPSVHPALPPLDQQLLRISPTPDVPLCFRWNLRPSLTYQDAKQRFSPFNRLQAEDKPRRRLMAQLVARALSAGREVYVIANNKAEGSAPWTLLRLLEELLSVQNVAAERREGSK